MAIFCVDNGIVRLQDFMEFVELILYLQLKYETLNYLVILRVRTRDRRPVCLLGGERNKTCAGIVRLKFTASKQPMKKKRGY